MEKSNIALFPRRTLVEPPKNSGFFPLPSPRRSLLYLWLAGMLAGVAYTLLLYWTGRLWPCIFAHAVTNLALGIHVLVTGEWEWW